jgi:hypothetical protein
MASFEYPSEGVGAIVQAKFLTQQPDGTLTNEEALSLLATGLMKSTTGTGVVSIAAAGTDYVAPATTITAGAGLSGGGDLSTNRTISMPNVGPGAGAIGSSSSLVRSVTLDAQGRVTAVTATDVGALTTGLVKVTTTTGALTTAAGGSDYVVPGGVAGGQSIAGGTANSETLTLSSTAGVTKGKTIIGVSGSDFVVDEVNHRLGLGMASPEATLDIAGGIAARGTGTIASAIDSTLITFETGAVSNMTANSGRVEVSRPGTFRNLFLRGNDVILQPNGAAAPFALRAWSSGNVTIAVNTDVATSSLRVSAAKTIASATSAAWDGVDFIASTLTWSGNTAVTTASGVNFAVFRQPTLTAGSAVATTIAATVKIDGPPIAAGSATITKAISLWVGGSTACARFGNGVGDVTIECSTTFSSGTASNMITAANMGAGNRVSLGATSAFSVNPDGRALQNTTSSSNSWMRINSAATHASATSFAWDGGLDIMAATLTLSGNTAITTTTGVNLVNVSAPTISAGSALTVSNAATVYISGPPIAAGAGPATITKAAALVIGSGNVGIGSFPVARLEVVTDSDTTNGAPGSWDGKFVTVGTGGANGGALGFSYNQSTNIAFIEAITPGTSYRNISINNGALIVDGTNKSVGVATGSGGAATILNVGGTRALASSTSMTFDAVVLSAALTLSAANNITTATGVNLVSVPAPAYNAGSALTITHAASVYIGGAPVGGGAGPATITNAYALWIDSGKLRYDGAVALGGGASATFGTIGGSGPTTAAQNQWLPINIDGNARFIPVWA